MKLAIIIGVSNYEGSSLCNLPGCERDVKLIKTLLSTQDDYVDILEISVNTKSVDVKQQVIEFIGKHKNSDVSEFVFYYTGHGAFINGEYYFLLSDYQSSRLRQTCLENSELDNLIKTLSPALTTKIIDSCQSGVPYIKDQGELQVYLKGTQSRFQNCYFMFSSQSDESSYQDNILSGFTRSLGELVVSRTGSVRHKDIIDYVSDSFTQNSLQTPFFVVQADFTDIFCKVDQNIQKRISEILIGSIKTTAVQEAREEISEEDKLKSLIIRDANYYCTEDEAVESVNKLKRLIENYQPTKIVNDLFDIQIREISEYSQIPDIVPLGKWFEDSKHSYFAEPIKDYFKVKKIKTWATLVKASSLLTLGGSNFNESDYEIVNELKITGVRSTTPLPWAALNYYAISKYPNVNNYSCFLVPFISRIQIILFIGSASIVARGWNEGNISKEINWKSYQEKMKDGEALEKMVQLAINEFWDSILLPLKKKFGLLKEENQNIDDSKIQSDDKPSEQ